MGAWLHKAKTVVVQNCSWKLLASTPQPSKAHAWLPRSCPFVDVSWDLIVLKRFFRVSVCSNPALVPVHCKVRGTVGRIVDRWRSIAILAQAFG